MVTDRGITAVFEILDGQPFDPQHFVGLKEEDVLPLFACLVVLLLLLLLRRRLLLLLVIILRVRGELISRL